MANNTGPYVTVQQVRDSYPDATNGVGDVQIEALVSIWSAYFDKETKRWFNERDITFQIEGNNTPVMNFDVPIISIEYVKLNDSIDDLDADDYIVYNNVVIPDDRNNPKIKLIGPGSNGIFTGYSDNTRFLKNKMTEIKGKFGYLDYVAGDGITPYMVQQAILILVGQDLLNPMEQVLQQDSSAEQLVRREKTDLHEKEYYDKLNIGYNGVTGLRLIKKAIKMYKAPGYIGGSMRVI